MTASIPFTRHGFLRRAPKCAENNQFIVPSLYGFDGIDGLVQFMRKEINRLETQYEIEEEAIEERD